MAARPDGRQQEETFASPERIDEKDTDEDVMISVEVDLKSVATFLDKNPEVAKQAFDRAQKEKVDRSSLGTLEGTDFNNFLHDFLKSWWQFHNPKEKTTLVKAQTKQAVADLKKAIFSASPDVQDGRLLTRDQWKRFIERIKIGQVEHETISPLKAFETFAGKVFDPSDTGNKVEGDRQGVQIVYSGSNGMPIETPIQKYRRLKTEIKAFESALAQLASKSEAGADPTTTTVAQISKDLLQMNTLLSEQAGASTLLFEDNLSELNSMKTLNDQLVKTTGKEKAPAVYSLFSGSGNNSSRLTALENRLANIERIMGTSADTDAMTTIASLSAKLDVLGDPAKLQEIRKTVQTLTEHLETLKKEKKKVDPILAKQKNEKVDKLFTMMSRWDKAALQLPVVVERLKSLQLLNAEASGVVDLMNTLDQQTKTLAQALSEDRELLSQVSKTLATNSERIAQNIESLDSRIKAL